MAAKQPETNKAVVMLDKPAHNHYFRECPYDRIDVYRVLELFHVTDPVMQHIVKKALVAGMRGMKSAERDVSDIRDSASRWLEMRQEEAQ
jgi:hypothetical protein